MQTNIGSSSGSCTLTILAVRETPLVVGARPRAVWRSSRSNSVGDTPWMAAPYSVQGRMPAVYSLSTPLPAALRSLEIRTILLPARTNLFVKMLPMARHLLSRSGAKYAPRVLPLYMPRARRGAPTFDAANRARRLQSEMTASFPY